MDSRAVGPGRYFGSRVLCRIGRHTWVTHHNPEMSWEEGVFSLCRRCGRERQQYDPAEHGAVGGAGWIGGGHGSAGDFGGVGG